MKLFKNKKTKRTNSIGKMYMHQFFKKN